MRRPVALLLVLLSSGIVFAEDPAKKAIKLDWQPRAGERYQVTDEATSSRKLVSREGDKVGSTDETKDEHAFALSWEIISIDSKTGARKERRTYSKFKIQHESEEDGSLEGKSVVLERPRVGMPTADIEPRGKLGKLAKEYLEEQKYRDEGAGRNPLEPRSPVAPGDSWEVELTPALRLLGDPLVEVGLDRKKSSAHAKLVSLAQKDGASFGTIEVTIEAAVNDFASELKLEKGAVYKIQAKLEGCTDGSRPDRSLTVEGSLDGTAKLEGASVLVSARHTARLVVARSKE
ncbi:hypothetical protein HY251_01855 [bacterium]|nr:hypothetical protein [bacterium]